MQPFPEQFAQPAEIQGRERRLRPRCSPSTLTYVTLGENNGGIIANISETGIYVAAGEPLREDFVSRVIFIVPQAASAIQTQAEIVWMSESKKEAGVRFVGLGEESREQIRGWISPPRRNGNRVESPAESRRDGEIHASAAPAERSSESMTDRADRKQAEEFSSSPPALEGRARVRSTASPSVSGRDAPPFHGGNGSWPKSWALTEAQRAEFDRLFPSENKCSHARETAPAEIAVNAEPYPEPSPDEIPSFLPPSADAARQPTAAAAVENLPASVAKPPAEAAQQVAQTPSAPVSRTPPATATPRIPLPSPWDAPVPVPILGNALDSAVDAHATDTMNDLRRRSLQSPAALVALIVAACFVLGFAAGPEFLRAWPKAKDAGRMVFAKLSRAKTTAPNVGSADPSGVNSQPPHGNALASGESAASESSVPASGAHLADNAALSDMNTSIAHANTPASDAAKVPNTASAVGAASGGGAAPPAEERSTEPSDAAPRATAADAPAEKPRSSSGVNPAGKANSPLGTAHASVAQLPTPAPARDSSVPSGNTAMGANAPAVPPANTAEPATQPKALPQSYFPVVAPGAGNVPRLIELPEETVIDTAAVVIHSHQFVFVPAEPGPESSHALEKLEIGDRITKLAPIYPPAAARNGMGGTVHLVAVIGKDGRVQDVRPINGPIALITAAVDAILQWQYQPTTLDQQPIEMQEQFTIEFRPLPLPAPNRN